MPDSRGGMCEQWGKIVLKLYIWTTLMEKFAKLLHLVMVNL